MPLVVKSSSCRPVTDNVQYKHILNSRCLLRRIINAKFEGVGFFLGLNLLFKRYDVIDIFVNIFFSILLSQRDVFFIDGIPLFR